MMSTIIIIIIIIISIISIIIIITYNSSSINLINNTITISITIANSTTTTLPRQQASAVSHWRRLVLRARRLAFKRRCWAALGELLKLVKAQGRRGE